MNTKEDDETNAQNVTLIQNLKSTHGKFESPVNLDISNMKVIQLNLLHWHHHEVQPKKLKISNTGYTAILSAKWVRERPYLFGGPFTENYVFSQIHFHWGETDMHGSEHHIDGVRFSLHSLVHSMPMELHAVHFNRVYGTMDTALQRDDGLAVLVYFFKSARNEFMEGIVRSLSSIETAHTSVRLSPLPLTNILRPFHENYFLYWGSIVAVHYTHTILWIISREPIGISMEQVAQFRTLKNSRKKPIASNLRPLKEKGERDVFHVCPSGAMYASLLPIPRDTSHVPQDETTSTTNNRTTKT